VGLAAPFPGRDQQACGVSSPVWVTRARTRHPLELLGDQVAEDGEKLWMPLSMRRMLPTRTPNADLVDECQASV